MATLKDLEGDSVGASVPLDDILSQLKFNEEGMIPAIDKYHISKDVLILARMDRTSIKKKIE